MKTKFTIITGDESVTYEVKPKHILKSERTTKGDSPVEATYKLAYYASGSTLTFDEWIDSVDDIIPILPDDDEVDDEEAEEESIPPTTAGSRASRRTPE